MKFTFIADTCLNNTNFNETFVAEYNIYLLSLFKGKESPKKSLRFCECAPKIPNQAISFIEFGIYVMPLFGPGSLYKDKTLKIMQVKAIFWGGEYKITINFYSVFSL